MPTHDPRYYMDGLLKGDRRILSKTITLIESVHPEHQQSARRILELVLPKTGRAVRLGITGVPGVGKSTFIENFGLHLIQKEHRVAVLAVDPSSQQSGGSIMADKTRMEKLCLEANAFIRPSPAGGTLGGVAQKTRESMLVCEAAGFDVIIVETVGVGQSEITVASMVDFFLLLMLAGAGDEIQGIKKGILELADAIAVNKADQDNRQRAAAARLEYENALNLLRPASALWRPPVLTCSAVEQRGLNEIWDAVLTHRRIFSESGELDRKRKKQRVQWLRALLQQGLEERFYQSPAIKERLPEVLKAVEKGRMTPTAAADNLLFFLDKNAVV